MWDLQHIAKKALSRYISRRGFKVVLNGDGSDELFAGYSWLVLDRLQADDKQRAQSLLSASAQQREHSFLEHANKASWFGLQRTAGSEDQPANAARKVLNLPPGFRDSAVVRVDDWLRDDVRSLNHPFDAILSCYSAEEISENDHLHPLRKSMLAWSKTMLPNVVIAAISDGAEMARGVESRPPFLDHVVAEFASTLPVESVQASEIRICSTIRMGGRWAAVREVVVSHHSRQHRALRVRGLGEVRRPRRPSILEKRPTSI